MHILWLTSSIDLYLVISLAAAQEIPEIAYTRRFNSSQAYRDRLPGSCEDRKAFDCKEDGRTVCIDVAKLRDGNEDCQDGSDEWCPFNYVRCGSRGNCVLEEKFEKQCGHRIKKKICTARERDPVECREYEECILRSWLKDNRYDCLDESDEDCKYVARFLDAGEMNTKGCNASLDGAVLPEIPEASSEAFWTCFNNTAKKALDQFAGTPMCKCRSGSVYDSGSGTCKKSDTKSFEFRGQKICGESNIYSEGLKDPQSWYYKSVAAIMLQAVSEIIEKSNIYPKPELCFPEMDMKSGSVKFAVQIECENRNKACEEEELKETHRSSTNLQSAAETDKDYLLDITDLRCDRCDINAKCRVRGGRNGASVGRVTCQCKEGFRDLAESGLQSGQKCAAPNPRIQSEELESTEAKLRWLIIAVLLVILLLLCLTCCLWWWCCARTERQTDQVKPIMRSPSNYAKRGTWSAEKKEIRTRPSSSPSLSDHDRVAATVFQNYFLNNLKH